ncbi:hypothetical protein PYW07_005316 [Mythimna separata]|uniref:DNA-directed RNA polymerase n=1 Tax=Mythimna separata TaxID=271217 RepID=A0AAD7YE48_MYTSE|nr:hypothetical protein PYW07_005309 [Mythimna separata]KAJ8712468.1 hypothetical protein PYW07_005310 [Mythimna separata]KAJ8712469.1 hypothetical protein PYW07_005311 [Mythimna separata]KAJ8712470.1 hypothetical protein PYW07_005312 [Mythimna separata]KAJ8712471.1 hypothetical protein PYW07_005313 [Mythimna separata]
MGQWKRLECAPAETLYPVLDSLNQLGEVPWLINKPILDLQIQIFRMPFYVMGQWKRLECAPAETLYPVLDSLNQLGEVPWLINKPILDLQIQIFR